MCIIATHRFNSCRCRVIRHLICTAHVEHTHKQLDTAPCPNIELRTVETQEGGCGGRIASEPCHTRTSWAFESWTDHRYSEEPRKFCEERNWGSHLCDDGRWMLGIDHTCGMGRGEYRWWRHREVKKPEENDGVKKDVKEEMKEKVEDKVKREVKHEVKQEVKHEVKHEVKQEVKHEVKQEFKQEFKHEFKHELKHELKHEFKQEGKQEFKHEVKEEVKYEGGVKVDMDMEDDLWKLTLDDVKMEDAKTAGSPDIEAEADME